MWSLGLCGSALLLLTFLFHGPLFSWTVCGVLISSFCSSASLKKQSSQPQLARSGSSAGGGSHKPGRQPSSRDAPKEPAAALSSVEPVPKRAPAATAADVTAEVSTAPSAGVAPAVSVEPAPYDALSAALVSLTVAASPAADPLASAAVELTQAAVASAPPKARSASPTAGAPAAASGAVDAGSSVGAAPAAAFGAVDAGSSVGAAPAAASGAVDAGASVGAAPAAAAPSADDLARVVREEQERADAALAAALAAEDDGPFGFGSGRGGATSFGGAPQRPPVPSARLTAFGRDDGLSAGGWDYTPTAVLAHGGEGARGDDDPHRTRRDSFPDMDPFRASPAPAAPVFSFAAPAASTEGRLPDRVANRFGDSSPGLSHAFAFPPGGCVA